MSGTGPRRCAWLLAAALLGARPFPAEADCAREGNTVVCTGNTRGGVDADDDVSVTVTPGASVLNIAGAQEFGNCPLSPPVISVGARARVVNDGAILGFGTCAVGIDAGDNAVIVNRGSIDTVNAVAAGIAVTVGATVTNAGTITARGAVSNGVFGGDGNTIRFLQSSTVITAGSAAAGVFLSKNNVVDNAGTIRTSGLDAPAVELADDIFAVAPTFGTIRNSGLMEALGPRSVTVRAAADSVSLINSGQIRGLFGDTTRLSDVSRAVALTADTVRFDNSGLIAGAALGVEIAAAQDLGFANTGVITGQTDVGRAVSIAARRLSFVNTGQIRGRLAGARIFAVEGFEVENGGTIETTLADPDGVALLIETGASSQVILSNTGVIAAAGPGDALRLGEGGDIVVNAGVIRGGVRLGGGGDLMVVRRGGIMIGHLDGGAGSDRLLLTDSGVVTWTASGLEEFLVLAGEGGWRVAQNFSATGLVAVGQGVLGVEAGYVLSAPSITVVGGGVLEGLGTLQGRVGGGGALSPGPGVGTLSIAGELAQEAASTTRIEVGASGLSDRIAVSGQARLDGTLAITPIAGHRFRGGESYEVLTAGQGVSGAFSSITGLNGIFLTSTIVASPDNRSISIRINRIPYASVAQNPQQTNVARALDGALAAGRTRLSALTDQLDGLDAAQARRAFEQLSPRMPSAVLATLDGGSRMAMSAIPTRAGDENRIRAWGHVGRRQGSPGRMGYSFDMNALTAGLDRSSAENTRVGFVLSAQDGSIDQTGGTGKAAIDQTLAAAYAIHQWRDMTFSGGVAWADGAANMRRATASPFSAALQGTQSAKADTSALGGFIRASKPFSAGPLRITARLGAEAWRTTLGGFTEDGPLALTLPRQRMDSVRPLIGAEVSGASRLAAPFLSLTGSYELLDDDPVLAAFVDDPEARFAAPAARLRKTWLTAQAGVRAALGGTATLRLGFEGNLTDAAQGHTVFAGVSVAF